MLFINKKLKILRKKFQFIHDQIGILDEKLEKIFEEKEYNQVCAEMDSLSKHLEDFIENEYSKEVFDFYSKKKPKLIIRKSGELVNWEEAFGMDFYKLDLLSKHSLIGLLENSGKYKLK